jgi:cytochrome c oxidase subunit 3
MPSGLAPRPALQFADLAQQREVATLGLWLFLATEIMFFAGIMMAYLVYRTGYPLEFAEAGRHTKVVLGSINTAVLLTSSFAIALAVHFAETGRRRAVILALLATACLGLAFMGIKGVEYYQEYSERLVPGLNFRFEGPRADIVELFFLFYFIATGIHAVHVTIGIGLVLVMAGRAAGGAFSPAYFTPIEMVGLYWHFVDIVWIFLYPLIYLLGRSSS